MDPEAQGVPTPQDPQATPDPAPAADPTPTSDPAPVPTGPWADQLAQFDEALRPQVDGFLREHVQPYVTRLEQERSQVDPNAAQLYADLNDPEKAAATYLALTGELFDPDLVEVVKDTLMQHYGTGEPDPTPEPGVEPPARDPEVQALIDKNYADQYAKDVAKTVEENKIPDEFKDLIHPMIVSADGDIAAAGAALKAKLATAGIGAPAAPDPVIDPPPVPGVVPPAPPVAKDYGGDMGAAIDDFFDGMANTAPPPVGTV